MPSRSAFLGKLIGFYLAFFGIYILVQRQTALNTLTTLVHNTPLMLVCALLGMTAGLAIILSHNVWSGGGLPIIVTVAGWLALIKGLILLLLPPAAQPTYFEAFRFGQFMYFYAIVLLVLGAYLISAALGSKKAI
jgi:hypothetical protein